MGFRFAWALLLAAGCAAAHADGAATPTTPAAQSHIPQCGKLDGKLARDVDLLDHRLTLRVPAGGQEIAREYNIMSAPTPSAEESRIMVGGGASAGAAPGDDALAILAKETWQLDPDTNHAEASALVHPGSFATEATKFLHAVYDPELAVAPVAVADKSIKVFAGTPRTVASQGDAALVLAMLIALPDGTLQSISFHVSNGLIGAAKPCTELAQQIAQTIKLGTRTIDRTAGRRVLGPVAVTVPADYAVVHQQGPDFDVYKLFHLRPLSLYPGSLTIAIDEYPEQLDKSDHDEPGKLLGQSVRWQGRRAAKGGLLVAQTPLPGTRSIVQAVAQATRQEQYLDEFKKVAETLVVVR